MPHFIVARQHLQTEPGASQVGQEQTAVPGHGRGATGRGGPKTTATFGEKLSL